MSMGCTFYIEHKQRFCRCLVATGKKFCGEHLTSVDETNRRRIPCPYDPRQSFDRNLCKHRGTELLMDWDVEVLMHHKNKCNSRPPHHLAYYRPNLNSGDAATEPVKFKLQDISDEQLYLIIGKVQSIHQKYVGKIESYISDSGLPKNVNLGSEVARHWRQVSSLVGTLEREKLLESDSERVFVEFGAGRGALSNFLIERLPDNGKQTTLLLIDKKSQRHRFDSKVHNLKQLEIQRTKMDIQHLDLNQMQCIRSNQRGYVAYGKHLCGKATDYSLRCVANSLKHFRSALIALCCHNQCDWKSYTGKKFFEEAGLSDCDFSMILVLSGWAVCSAKESAGKSPNEQILYTDLDHLPPYIGSSRNRYDRMRLTIDFRESVGRMAKQVIDFGRIHFLKDLGIKAKLISYVESSHTLENTALLAIRDT